MHTPSSKVLPNILLKQYLQTFRLVTRFSFLGEINNTFIQQGHIKLIKSGGKNIYNIPKGFYLK